MSQLARRENAPHRAAFATSLSRWYIRLFAWQLASFPSQPVCGEEAPYCPLRDFATLRTYSPEIKAR